jgi:hypothetical protein
MADWITEGAAARSTAQIAPVRHLLVQTDGGWSLWCSGGKGSPQTAVLGNDRFHRECIALANAAIAEHTLDPADVSGWPVNQCTAEHRPDDETEYRIDFTITRRQPGDDDFAEIGFGSSGAWPDVEQCAHMLESDITHRQWETSGGMPGPATIDRSEL